MLIKDLMRRLYTKYPLSIARKYRDPSGYQLGDPSREVKKILVVLDVDEFVLEVVKKDSVDLIISHHPFIYGKKKDVFAADLRKKATYDALKELGITVYSIHMPFDEARDGMNDELSALLELTNVSPIIDAGRVGTLKHEMELKDFARYIKEKLSLSYVLVNAIDKNKPIFRVAIIGGGGASYWREIARADQVDCFISSDVKHYERRDMLRYDFCYIDIPHEIENVFVRVMSNVIRKINPNLEVTELIHESPMEIQ